MSAEHRAQLRRAASGAVSFSASFDSIGQSPVAVDPLKARRSRPVAGAVGESCSYPVFHGACLVLAPPTALPSLYRGGDGE
jgi:hypothetical protein